jgi:hypothetical protein
VKRSCQLAAAAWRASAQWSPNQQKRPWLAIFRTRQPERGSRQAVVLLTCCPKCASTRRGETEVFLFTCVCANSTQRNCRSSADETLMMACTLSTQRHAPAVTLLRADPTALESTSSHRQLHCRSLNGSLMAMGAKRFCVVCQHRIWRQGRIAGADDSIAQGEIITEIAMRCTAMLYFASRRRSLFFSQEESPRDRFALTTCFVSGLQMWCKCERFPTHQTAASRKFAAARLFCVMLALLVNGNPPAGIAIAVRTLSRDVVCLIARFPGRQGDNSNGSSIRCEPLPRVRQGFEDR